MLDNCLKLFCNESLDYLSLLFDKGQDVFWIVNSDYSAQIYVNASFERIWGYKHSVLAENPLFWIDTILEEDRLQLASISRLPHSCVLSYYQEKYRIRRADGEVRWILDHTYPLLDSIGRCVGYAGIAQDITHTINLERELQIANKFLPKLAEKMEHSAFWVRDATMTKQLYLSKGFEKIWQRPMEYVYENPQNWLKTVVSDSGSECNSIVPTMDVMDKNAQSTRYYQIARPDGDVRWIRDISFPIYDEHSDVCLGFAGIAEDITQEKTYEIELQKSKDRAEAANIAKSNFLASISHDLRTPLNGLLGMAEMMQSNRCYPEQKEYIDAILQSGNTLLDLVDDVINFVALDLNKLPIKNEWFNLKDMLDELIRTGSQQADQKQIALLVDYDEQIPKEIFGDLGRIRRIVMNLLNNAIKFTNKGHVRINVAVRRKSKSKIWLQFIIEDTGIGISKDNYEYIFGSFNRTDLANRGRYKGTGLGLTIVKQFLEDLGGSIKLKSKPNQGSSFYCNLPFTLVPSRFSPEIHHGYSELKILLIDDFSKRGDTFIKQYGLKNAFTINSLKAIGMIREANSKHSPFQLIIIDDELQEDVIELAKLLRREINCNLILITDADSELMIQQIKKVGYAECIPKPLQHSVVVEVLERAALTPAIQKYSSPKDVIAHQMRKVLLIEDDLLTQKITRWMLEELNWQVEIAASAGQALTMLENHYDLIITDVGLPDMDGISLVQSIRKTKQKHKDTIIIALTAHVMDKDKEKCMEAGMNEFLKKPLFKKDLKKLLLKLSANG